VRDTKVVCASYWHDREVMHSGYRCMQSTIYLVVLLRILNMGVQVEILCMRSHLEGEQQQKTNEFPRHFIYLNVIFLQHVFEALNNVFSYSKTTRT
jgi:hypothetical protein